MRFCMVTTFYPPYHFGGDATYVRSLSRALVELGHEVEVIHCEDAFHTVNKGSETSHDTNDEGITVHRLKNRFGFLSALITQQTGRPGLKAGKLRTLLDRDFDVVNFHNISLVGGPGVLAMSKAPITLYTLHEHWLVCPTHILWKNRSHACDGRTCFTCSLRSAIPPQLWRYTGLINRSLENVDMLLSPSEFTAQQHRDGGIECPIQILKMFSSLDPGSEIDEELIGRPKFIYAGRMTASKGIASLLEVFSDLDDCELLVLGEGDLRLPLQQQYADKKNIKFMGFVPQAELVSIYKGASALLYPSLAPEAFALGVPEAYACGLPTIVRDAGANKAHIDATGAGFVYRTQDELRQAIKKIASDRGLRLELGRKARSGYEKYYTKKQHLDNYLNCISDISKKKGIRLPQ